MIFTCQNCGANVPWNADKQQMFCSFCESENSEMKKDDPTNNGYVCANCGAAAEPGEYTSAMPCEFCGSSTIFDERIQGEYTPHLILPFKISKEKAKELIRAEFGKMRFLPDSFLAEASLDHMQGEYVPFYLFDVDGKYQYQGEGKKIRTWYKGNTHYTETSIYNVVREMDVDFAKLPADASLKMPDDEMDLIEPYDYAALEEFQEKYMSGYWAERYSVPKDELKQRIKIRAKKDASVLVKDSFKEYASVKMKKDDFQGEAKGEHYSLLPVWSYNYTFNGKTYHFHLNGQTGKLVGKAPISYGKMALYAGTVGICVMLMGMAASL